MGRAGGGRQRPGATSRALERIQSTFRRQGTKVPAKAEAPRVPNFNRNRTNFDIDIANAFRRPGNGLRQAVVLSRDIIIEQDFFRWQQQVGKVGDPGTSRAEHMIFRSFERAGWRFPESRPPGLDVEYLARVAGNVGGIEIDFFIRERSIAIRCQGEYWHFKDSVVIEEGQLERAILVGQGLTVVDILAQDTKTTERTDYVVSLAMNGFEVDISGRVGVFR